jgi:hypothetical protein
MFSFGVTLWEIFSSHTPYDTNAKTQRELKASLPFLLRDLQNPLRPDLELVDPRVRPMLQVNSHTLTHILSFEKYLGNHLMHSTTALLGHGP